jgi:hypothetical protein
MVHVKDGVNLITNGNSNSNCNIVGRRQMLDLLFHILTDQNIKVRTQNGSFYYS